MATKLTALDISGTEKKKLKKPKKLSKEKALVIAEQPEKQRISKLKNVNKMRSILGDSAEEIQQLLESNNTDSATTLMQKRLMQTLIDMLPYAENNIRKSKGALIRFYEKFLPVRTDARIQWYALPWKLC